MFRKKQLVHNSGQSLIEVLVALSLAVLAIGALVTVTMTSVKNAQFSKNQTQAEKYAQEGMEWARLQKENLLWTGTGNFFSRSGSEISPNKYCLNTFPVGAWSGACAVGTVIPQTIFMRELSMKTLTTLTNCGNIISGKEPILAVVTVSWPDSSGSHATIRETCFTNWEKK